MKSNKSTGIVLGILLLIVGIGYVGNVFEVWKFTIFFRGWWTLLIIVPAVVAIARHGFKRKYLVWLGGGLLLLLTCSGILPDIVSKLVFPMVVIALGFAIIFRGSISNAPHSSDGSAPKNVPSYTAVLSGRTPNLAGKRFDGAFCTAILGGVDLKLKESEIADGATIDILSIFGGVDVILPPGVNAEISCIPVLGGVSEPKDRPFTENAPTVYINAVCILGGADVK